MLWLVMFLIGIAGGAIATPFILERMEVTKKNDALEHRLKTMISDHNEVSLRILPCCLLSSPKPTFSHYRQPIASLETIRVKPQGFFSPSLTVLIDNMMTADASSPDIESLTTDGIFGVYTPHPIKDDGHFSITFYRLFIQNWLCKPISIAGVKHMHRDPRHNYTWVGDIVTDGVPIVTYDDVTIVDNAIVFTKVQPSDDHLDLGTDRPAPCLRTHLDEHQCHCDRDHLEGHVCTELADEKLRHLIIRAENAAFHSNTRATTQEEANRALSDQNRSLLAELQARHTKVAAGEKLLAQTLDGLIALNYMPIVWLSLAAILTDLRAHLPTPEDPERAPSNSVMMPIFVRHLQPDRVPLMWLTDDTGRDFLRKYLTPQTSLEIPSSSLDPDFPGLFSSRNLSTDMKRPPGSNAFLLILTLGRVWMMRVTGANIPHLRVLNFKP